MQKLFGTDGIRAQANTEPLTPQTLVKIGKAVAVFFRKKNHGLKKIVIGKDTRLSGYLLETALTSGIVSMGVDVLLVGPMPTPAIAHLTRSLNADAGIVLSASHNVATDNGVKIFDSSGVKLDEKSEAEIEQIVFSSDFGSKNERIGKAFRIDDARGRYIEFVKASISSESLKDLNVVVDCANGAAYSLAERIFSELGVSVLCVNNKPNGENINLDCGAMHPEVISRLVKKNNANAGIAFDGDADRVVFCDETGEIVHGDQLLGIFALDLKKNQKLKNDSLVVTVLSNKGFFDSMKENGIQAISCDVGDKNVINTMRKNGVVFGGEQSGHIIFSESSTTGDGLVAALHLLRIMKTTGKKLSELKKAVRLLPQENMTVKVREKKPFESMSLLQKEILKAQKTLAGTGRLLVRYSGTENAVRIMVEAQSEKFAKQVVENIASAIKQEIGA